MKKLSFLLLLVIIESALSSTIVTGLISPPEVQYSPYHRFNVLLQPRDEVYQEAHIQAPLYLVNPHPLYRDEYYSLLPPHSIVIPRPPYVRHYNIIPTFFPIQPVNPVEIVPTYGVEQPAFYPNQSPLPAPNPVPPNPSYLPEWTTKKPELLPPKSEPTTEMPTSTSVPTNTSESGLELQNIESSSSASQPNSSDVIIDDDSITIDAANVNQFVRGS